MYLKQFVAAGGILAALCLNISAASRIVAFGDSTTAPRKGVSQVYADRLAVKLGDQAEVINSGVPSNTTETARQRFEKDVLSKHPSLVIIQFGINDSTVDVWKKTSTTNPRVALAEYENNLRYFINELTKRKVGVILMTPNSLRWTPRLRKMYGKSPYKADEERGFNVSLDIYADTVRRIAKETNIPLVDVNRKFDEALDSGSLLLLDGMHPNDKGHELVFEALYPEVQKLLKQSQGFSWEKIPPIPEATGYAGTYAGISNDALIVAGGTHFPDKFFWEGGKKVWSDKIYILKNPNEEWITAGQKLPHPLGMGASVSTPEGVFCIGGEYGDKYFAETFFLKWEHDKIEVIAAPDLPVPLAKMAAALVGDTVYVAGGSEDPRKESSNHFFALNLSLPQKDRAWMVLPSWPGPSRVLAVAGAGADTFYLVSGIEVTRNKEGKLKNTIPYLKDAFGFNVENGTWKKLSDLPAPVAAAASPMPEVSGKWIIFGGIDGSKEGIDPKNYPPFPSHIHAYDSSGDYWEFFGDMPANSSRVVLPCVKWRSKYVLISGEKSPGQRSPENYVVSEAL